MPVRELARRAVGCLAALPPRVRADDAYRTKRKAGAPWHLGKSGLSDHRARSGSPWAYREALPALYCVTLCRVCFLHLDDAQNVLRVLGVFTICNSNQGGDG